MSVTDLFEPVCRLADLAGWPAIGGLLLAGVAARADRSRLSAAASAASVCFAALAATGDLAFLAALFFAPALLFAGGDHLSRETLSFLRAGIAPSWSRGALTEIAIVASAAGFWRLSRTPAARDGSRLCRTGAAITLATGATSVIYAVLAATHPDWLFPRDAGAPEQLGDLPSTLLRQCARDLVVSAVTAAPAVWWLRSAHRSAPVTLP